MKSINAFARMLTFGCVLAACLGMGCATTGPVGDIVPLSQVGQSKVIVVQLPYNLRMVKQDLWERAMVDFGLEETMIEHLSETTRATIMTGRLAEDALNPARAEAAKQVRDFVRDVSQTPNVTKSLPAVIEAQLANHPMAQAPDFVLAGWISRFDVLGTTRSFAGPLSGQNRDCRIRGEVALYDVNAKQLYRNRGDGTWSVKAMAMVVTPTNMITDFDLSAASRASQDSLKKGIDNLFGAGAVSE